MPWVVSRVIQYRAQSWITGVCWGLTRAGPGHGTDRTGQHKEESEKAELEEANQDEGANRGAPWGNTGAPGINEGNMVIRERGFSDGMSEG